MERRWVRSSRAVGAGWQGVCRGWREDVDGRADVFEFVGRVGKGLDAEFDRVVWGDVEECQGGGLRWFGRGEKSDGEQVVDVNTAVPLARQGR